MGQYAVWVEFDVMPRHFGEFRAALLVNARSAVATEPGCLRFDVLDAAASASRIHLYEIYADEAAFKAHLETPHFKVFDRLAGPWLEPNVRSRYADREVVGNRIPERSRRRT
jgi:(4S)-4-hydroxy-5-phosphonooxypentane-2,3-dione isomerase